MLGSGYKGTHAKAGASRFQGKMPPESREVTGEKTVPPGLETLCPQGSIQTSRSGNLEDLNEVRGLEPKGPGGRALSSKFGTNQTVTDRFWPTFEPFSVRKPAKLYMNTYI